MRKKHLFVLSSAILAMSLTSCISTKGNEETNPTTKVEVTLDSNYKCTLTLLIPSGNSNETTMIDSLTTGFNAKFPNITIEKNYVSVNNWESTVRNQNIAGTLPDIIWSNTPDYYYLVSAKIAEPLDPYFTAATDAGVFDINNDFVTEFMDMGAVNGTHYLLPRSTDTVVTFYNKSLLNAAGIDTSVIKDGWSWDTFEDVLSQYRAYLDRSGKSDWYCLDANLTTWLSVNYPILRSFGSEVIDKSGNIKIDSQETKNALRMTRELMLNKYIVADGVTPGNSFEIGTAPFLFQSAAFSLYGDRKVLKDKIDIVSFPLIQDNNSPKIGAGLAGYAMNAKSKEKAAAWQFLSYMMSKEGQNLMATGGLNLPSIRKDLQDWTKEDVNWGKGYSNANLNAYTFGSEYKITAEFLSYVDLKYKADIDSAVKDMFSKTIKSSVDDVDTVIETAISNCVEDIEDAFDA